MNDNLLDDRNIESVHKGSFIREVKRIEVWLSLWSTLGVLLGLALSLIGLSVLATDNPPQRIILMGVMSFVQGGLFLYWAYTGFQYTKSAKWYDPERISKRLEHLLEDNNRLWRATALLFLWLLCTIGVVAWMGFPG